MWATLYTDGSYLDHINVGIWAVRAKWNFGEFEEAGLVESWVTCSSSTEIYAIIKGVELLKKAQPDLKGIGVRTDSQTAYTYLRYYPKGVPGFNRKDWLNQRQVLYNILGNTWIKLVKVAAHQKDRSSATFLNNYVDQMTKDYGKTLINK